MQLHRGVNVSPESGHVMKGCPSRGQPHLVQSTSLTPLSHLPLQLNVNHQRVCNPEMLGKLVHLGFDAILISAVLAGIKRSTGLTCVSPFPKLDARVVTKTYLRSHDRMQACINPGAEQGCSS